MEDVVASVGSSFAERRYRCDEDIMAVVVMVICPDALPYSRRQSTYSESCSETSIPVRRTLTQLKVWYSHVNVTQIPRHNSN